MANELQPVEEGLVVHLDAKDERCYAGKGLLWRDLKDNFPGELPGDAANPFADPHWNGSAFVFRGYNFIRLLGSQTGFFKSFTKPGTRFTIDCCFRTGSRIANPHFLLADCAHGNPVEGCGFSFYFYNFQNRKLRLSIQNNAQTPLTRAVHCTHDEDVRTDTFHCASMVVDEPNGVGCCTLDDIPHHFDAKYVDASTRDSPYYVNIGAPGNIEYNTGARWETHVSLLEYRIDGYENLMNIPYGRMRFNPGFELFNMLVYDRALGPEEIAANHRAFRQRHDPNAAFQPPAG